MKKKLNRFLNEELSEKETDAIMEELITQKMDSDLRERLENILENEHGITRKVEKKIGKVKYLKYVLAVAASVSILIALLFYPNDAVDSPELLAQQYLNEQEFKHPGAFKGATVLDEQRPQAIASFNRGDFKMAINHFKDITSPTVEDTYYLGLSYLKSGQNKLAITELEKSKTFSERFVQEIHWFLALAHLSEGEIKKAEKELKTIKSGEWRYEEARYLLGKIKNTLKR